MSRYLQHNEMTYELHDNEEQRSERRVKLRVVYAVVDPAGWDAQKLTEAGAHPAVLWAGLKEVHAGQQAAHHPRAGLAGHVPGGPGAAIEDRVAAGLP